MIPGSIFSIISGFMNYSSNKLNSKKLENFEDNKVEKKIDELKHFEGAEAKCFITDIEANNIGKNFVKFLISFLLLIVILVYLYIFFWIPWSINEKKRVRTGELNKYRILIILGIFFPIINIFISTIDSEEFILNNNILEEK